VAPAIYGGIQLGIHTGERWTSERVNTPQGLQVGGCGWGRGGGGALVADVVWVWVCGLQLVLFIPDFIGKTSDARAVLEVRSAMTDAVLTGVPLANVP
jgi:homoserine kinase